MRTGVRLVLPDTDAAATLAELLRGAGVTVELDPDFITAAWRKLLVNAVVGFMVLTGGASGMFRRDDVAALARRYLAECLAVARADGANLGDEVIDEIIGMLAQAPAGHHHVDADRPGGGPAAGVGHPQRRHLAQGRRARAGHPDQRRAGAVVGRGQRRSRLKSARAQTVPMRARRPGTSSTTARFRSTQQHRPDHQSPATVGCAGRDRDLAAVVSPHHQGRPGPARAASGWQHPRPRADRDHGGHRRGHRVESPPSHGFPPDRKLSTEHRSASVEEFRIETTERGCRLTWSTARRSATNLRRWLMRVVRTAGHRAVDPQAHEQGCASYIEQRFGPTIRYRRLDTVALPCMPMHAM